MKINKFFKQHSFSVSATITVIGSLIAIVFVFFSYIVFQKFNVENNNFPVITFSTEVVKAKENKVEKNLKKTETENKNKIKPPKLTTKEPPNSKWDAESVLVKDHETNKILVSKNIDKKHPMASITKLITALVLLETEPNWSQQVEIISEDVAGTHVYPGEEYSYSKLWSASLVASSNKSILSLVESLSWPRQAFIQRMNQKAQEIGMKDTIFVEPTGLDKNNVSTAKDISLLLGKALKQEKINKELSKREVNLFSDKKNKKHHSWNTDWLLLGWIPNDFAKIYGGKTGYIETSGYNFTVRVSDKKGHILDVVVLGADSHEDRFTIARDAARWAFDNYIWPDEKGYGNY